MVKNASENNSTLHQNVMTFVRKIAGDVGQYVPICFLTKTLAIGLKHTSIAFSGLSEFSGLSMSKKNFFYRMQNQNFIYTMFSF